MHSKQDTWNGNYYKDHSKVQEECALTILDKIDFSGNEAVLDICCRNGKITSKIAQLVPEGKVVGIDISPSMIETAQQSNSHFPNLSFEISDATNFVFEQKFDYVVSSFAFHWIKDQLVVLKNIKNVLKRNGRVFIVMAIANSNCPIEDYFKSLKDDGLWGEVAKYRRKTIHPKSVKEFEDLLKRAGFASAKVEAVQIKSLFNTFQSLVQWFMGWIPHSTNLSHEPALKFSYEIAKNMYHQHQTQLDQPINFSVKFLSIEAKK